MDEKKTLDLNVEELEERIAPAHISLPVTAPPPPVDVANVVAPPFDTSNLPGDAPPV